ncbi:MAG: YraN family protein [bacterium]
MLDNRTEKRIVGDIGEDLACRFLINKGWRLVDRNYLKKCGEIDLILEDQDNVLHFIEVKTVSADLLGNIAGNVNHETNLVSRVRPEENIHQRKLERVIKTANLYLLSKKISQETKWQIDAVIVYLDRINKKSSVKLLENII